MLWTPWLLLLMFAAPVLEVVSLVISVPFWKFGPQALGVGYVATVLWSLKSTWGRFKMRKHRVGRQEIFIDFHAQHLVASQSFDYFPERDLRQQMPLTQVGWRVRRYIAEPGDGGDNNDAILIYLDIRPGHGVPWSMPWVESALEMPVFEQEFNTDSEEALVQQKVDRILHLVAQRVRPPKDAVTWARRRTS
jgi:hypothetical protein